MNRLVPLLLMGIILAAYWGRVMRMAYKARIKGRASHLVPPERIGKILRLIWTPLILIWVSQPFVTAFARKPPWPWRTLYDNSRIAWPAVILVALCFVATRICWKRMGSAWRMGIDPAEKTVLIATGPFAYVRHPIYALSQVMMLATVAAVPSLLMIASGMMHLILLQWESRREEAHLLRVQPEQYARYQSQVGRFLPKRLRPYIGARED
jgi:protein-S-isoprenylcysteine O-methyltransferase Ste14